MAATFNLNHHASYVHWHFFQMSVSNLLAVVAMLVVCGAPGNVLPVMRFRMTARLRPRIRA
jgi:hypothetical protein